MLRMFAVAVMAFAMVGCGQLVEVGPAQIGKVMDNKGYKEGTIPTSKFRLEFCMREPCEKLVVLDASDRSFKETMDLFMPQDKLLMDFDIRATLSMDPADHDQVFAKVTPRPQGNSDRVYSIPLGQVYDTYARDVIRAEVREFLSQFTISEIASSREAINAQLSERLSQSISERTPFKVR